MTSLNHSASDATSSSYDYSALSDSNKVVDVNANNQEYDYSSYDEFCMMMRIRAGSDFEETNRERSNELTTTSHSPKKFSYVSNWREKVDTSSHLTITVPPSPLFHTFDSPSSPVASIDPSRLYVTSVPPSSEYEHSSYYYSPSSSSGTGQSEFLHQRGTEGHLTKEDEEVPPAFHHEIYHSPYTPTLDDEVSTIETSSSLSMSPDPAFPKVYIHVPQVGPTGYNPTKPTKSTRFRNVSSAIRWLPTRIKYSILSQTAHRGASRK
ncbi:hypothetical protein C8R41DRAFT_913016 [Lentinula lateritia]|uniref:Uncharacterized protein n=1 Tax=Lentinula lateritia TaxID=40482 RepID=A0ABQ8VZH3_9AGAR|nr:hypothetical protein C8R41DRAFT_913016 [Lentinula lateritia]